MRLDMQGLWYGDKRDRVKWGALVYLSREQKISCIVQVAYFRHGPDLKLQINECEVEREEELPQEVWNHFSDLMHIERLGDAIGKIIVVLDHKLKLIFDPYKRNDYITAIVSEIKNPKIVSEMKNRSPKIVFLDPDTGIEPNTRKPEHVAIKDMQEIWKALSMGDLLAVYQHSDRTEKWLPARKKTMSSACGGAYINTITGKGIASDVAMLWCCKGSPNEDVSKNPAADLKPAKTVKKGRLCACPCGKMTKGGYFCPGHDAKLKSIFLKVSRDKKNKNELDKIRLRMYEIWSNDKSKPLKDIAIEVLG
jgi:hypothetical protein